MKAFEEELILKAQGGDSYAFGLLYDAYVSQIYRFIFLKLGGMKAEAEDITHQVFMSAWKNIKKYQFQGYPFSSWLYKIARNEVIDFWRTKKNNVSIHDIHEEFLGETDENELSVDIKIDTELVSLCIKRLDSHYQDVLILKFVEELTNEEIAKAMGKTEGSVRVIQHRAIKKLKQEIEHERAHH